MSKAKSRRMSPEAKRARIVRICQKFLQQLPEEEFKSFMSKIETERLILAFWNPRIMDQFTQSQVMFNRFVNGGPIQIRKP